MGSFSSWPPKVEWGDPDPVRIPVVAKPKGFYDRGDPEKDSGRKIKKGKKKKR